MLIETVTVLLKTARQIIDATRAERDQARARVAELEEALAARDGTIRTMHEDSLAAVRETVAERDQARADFAEFKSEVEAVLSAGPSIRVREGGGPEDLRASLAATVSKLRTEVRSLKHPRAFNMFGYGETVAERDALKAKLAEAEKACAAINVRAPEAGRAAPAAPTRVTCPCTVCACPISVAPWGSGEVCWHCQEGLHSGKDPVRLPAPEDMHGVPTERP